MKLKISTLIFLAASICSSKAIEIHCDFRYDHWVIIGNVYTCAVMGLNITRPFENVTEIIGNHRDGKTNFDVKKINIQEQNCEFLPKNFEQFFPNLEGLRVAQSGLVFLTQSDISVFPKLRSCDMFHNYIRVLDGNLFAKNPEIEYLYFGDNRIESIGEDVLLSLNKLKKATFQGNICISKNANYAFEVQDLQMEMNIGCNLSPSGKSKEILKKYELSLKKIEEEEKRIEEMLSIEEISSKTDGSVLWIFALLIIAGSILFAVYYLRKKKFHRGRENGAIVGFDPSYNEMNNEPLTDNDFNVSGESTNVRL